MVKRNYVEEILSIRLRNEANPRWGIALIQLQALENDIKKAADFPPGMARYFPIAIVATIEAYFRAAIKELIDFGPPFSENASNFDKSKNLSLDFRTVLAIQGKAITIGDLVSHVLPLKSLEDIDHNLTTVIGPSFLESLKSTQDRWAIEIEGIAPRPIIEDPSEVYMYVKETFRLRHIYCHEIGIFDKPNTELITKCFFNSSIFLKAADQLIWNLVAPHAPLSQSAMNAQAFRNFEQADQDLKNLCASITSLLDDDEKVEFGEAQRAWVAFREREASSYANRWGKGGSIWPTLNASDALTSTLSRIDELKSEFEHIKKKRSYRLKKDDL